MSGAEPAAGHDPAALHQVRSRLQAYLGKLGVTAEDIAAPLLDESMRRAERRSAPGDADELLRRALEELQRRIDSAVAKALDLNTVTDTNRIAAARARALLSRSPRQQLQSLLKSATGPSAAAPALPFATPPEERLSMHPEPIAFFFGPPTSTAH